VNVAKERRIPAKNVSARAPQGHGVSGPSAAVRLPQRKHIYAQIIEDTTGTTLVSASTVVEAVGGDLQSSGNVAAAKHVGKKIAEQALAKNITQVVFDRNGFLYHGRIKALADAAREAGLSF